MALLVTLGFTGGCGKKGKSKEGSLSISCDKQYDRNRQCADQVVAALSAVKELSAAQRAKLAKDMRQIFTTEDYLRQCKRGLEERHELSKRKLAEQKQFDADIVACHAKSDCKAYAACYAAAIKKR